MEAGNKLIAELSGINIAYKPQQNMGRNCRCAGNRIENINFITDSSTNSLYQMLREGKFVLVMQETQSFQKTMIEKNLGRLCKWVKVFVTPDFYEKISHCPSLKKFPPLEDGEHFLVRPDAYIAGMISGQSNDLKPIIEKMLMQYNMKVNT